MKERINQFLSSYDSLLDDVELANTKLGWNNRFLGKCGIVGVAVAGLASLGFVIAGVGLMFNGHASREKILGAVLAIPGLGAILFLRSCETVAFDQADELTRTRNRVKQTIAALREICTAVEKLSEGSSLQTLTASISDLQTEINAKPESRLEIADVNPKVREKGEKLVQLCNTLDLELTELEKHIQVLRDQVVGAHRARYKFIR
jgi:biotin operon repressor